MVHGLPTTAIAETADADAAVSAEHCWRVWQPTHRHSSMNCRLHHPCLYLTQVRFYYSFTSKENLYIVMEYLNGGDCYR